MSGFLKVLKKVTMLMLILISILATFLFYINKKPINFSINTSITKNIDIILDNISLSFKDYKVKVEAPIFKITKHKKNTVSLSNVHLNLDPWLLTGDFSADFNKTEVLPLINDNITKHNYILFDGDIKIKFLLNHLTEAKLSLTSNEGWNDPNIEGLEKIKLQECNVSLSYESKKLVVQNFNLKYDNGLNALMIGNFILNSNELESAKFKAEVSSLPIDYLAGLWPKILFPEIHTWVASHINGGMVNYAGGEFVLSEEDLKTGLPTKESINAEIEIVNTHLHYLDNYSPLKNINGKVKFDGETLYLSAKDAKLFEGVELNDFELQLPFESFVVSMTTKVKGPIKQFREFVSDKSFAKFSKYRIDFNKIEGNIDTEVNFTMPIEDEFDLRKLKLKVIGGISNVVLDKLKIVRIKQANIELVNDSEKVSFKVNDRHLFSFEFIEHHDFKDINKDKADIDVVIALPKKIDLNVISLNSGSFKVHLALKENEWRSRVDLEKAEVYIAPLGYTKPKKTPIALECNGIIESPLFIGNNCFLQGKGFAGDIKFSYSTEDNKLIYLNLDNMIIDKDDFSFAMAFNENHIKYDFTAKYFDISKLNFGYFEQGKRLGDYQFDFKIDKLLCKNGVSLDDLEGSIGKEGNNFLDVNISAYSKEDNSRFEISKALKNGKMIYALYAKPAAKYAQAFGIYKNVKKGQMWIELEPKREKGKVVYTGKLNLLNFAFTNTSALSKVVMGLLSPLNSPFAVVDALQGGAMQVSSFTADLGYKNSVLSLKNGLMIGGSYKIKINGNIGFKIKRLDFKGLYVPSAYGINTFISSIPILGPLLTGGKKSALIAAKFSITGDFDDPTMDFNPLSMLIPGFLRNFIP